jgi:Flp pilus assembly protein TadG
MRREHGQAAVLTVLFLAVLLCSAAAVIDVGSWFREDRDTQRAADAAALAGAQALPEDQSTAQALALEYAGKNGGGVLAEDVTFSTTVLPGDTISVDVDRSADSFFAKIVGMDSVGVGSTAKARAGVPNEARYAAPITVNEEHPMLNNCSGPCFGEPTSIDLLNLHGPGDGDAAAAFGLLNLHRGGGGNEGAEEVAGWLEFGYADYMPLGIYQSVPSANFNSDHMDTALTARLNDEVLFPIYREPILGGGVNARFNIIGWVGFLITGYNNNGANGRVDGSFTRVIWEGILTNSGGSADFGVRSVALID